MNTIDAHESLHDFARRWSVEIRRTRTTPGSVLGFGLAASQPVVLKVSRFPHEEWSAGAALEAFAGNGIVRVIVHAPGAVLLEELKPATPLVRLVSANRDDDATRILADTIAAMQAASLPTAGFPSAADWGRAFAWYHTAGRDDLPADLVQDAHDVYARLCRTSERARLLHGDLHHSNVVSDDHRGWLAIDPKGVIADLEFEIGAALRNPDHTPELYTSEALERRIGLFVRRLHLNPDRVVQWAFAQAILSAIWQVQDGERPDRNSPALRVAVAAREIIA